MTMETEESKHILIFHGKKNNKKVHKRRRARRARKINEWVRSRVVRRAPGEPADSKSSTIPKK